MPVRREVMRHRMQPHYPVRLDRSHPLAADLSMLWCAPSSDVDLTGNAALTHHSTEQVVASPGGSARVARRYTNNGVNVQHTTLSGGASTTGPCTLAALIPRATVGSITRSFAGGSGSGDCRFRISSAGAVDVYIWSASRVSSSNALADGDFAKILCWYDGNVIHVNLNGTVTSSAAVGGSFGFGAMTAIGGDFINATGGHDITLAAYWTRMLSEPERAAWLANPWAMFDPIEVLYFLPSGGGGAAALAGAGTGTTTATAMLTTAIQAAGAASGVATATGALTTGIPLAVAAAVTATASGNLAAQIQFSAVALAIATGVAALSTGIPLQGDAIAAAVATGALTTGGSGLEGAAMAQALATGDLTTAVLLASDAFATAMAQAGLTTGIPLSAAAQGTATASATLTTSIQLAGQGAAVATAAADLTGGSGSAQLQGAAQVVASATGDLSTGIPLAGAAVASAIAAGTLTVQITLSGSALAQAIAQGGLTTAIQLSGAGTGVASAAGNLGPSGILVIDPRFHAIAPGRSWAVTA